ncbi:MAG: ABC transporter substrate-binding protein [Bacillus subtilis]|nr:ABC transporter substrate-binding protein [Bacillus subtilis]
MSNIHKECRLFASSWATQLHTTGVFAGVGLPFNDAIRAVFKQMNDAGGINGRLIELVTYDDQFNATNGLNLTKKLVEENKVFALVGHFGTPTVAATIPYIQNVGIPMVYAASGINALYFAQSVGNPIMAVQPIYLTDGRLMTARALKESVYGATGNQPLPSNAKVGVLYTNDDVGNSIKAGVELEASILGKTSDFVYVAINSSTVNNAVTNLKNQGVQTVILAMNQSPASYSLTAMHQVGLNVPVFTSYVNADVSIIQPSESHPLRPIFTNAWVDITSSQGQLDYQAFVATIAQANLPQATKEAYYSNSFRDCGIHRRCDFRGRVETS